MRKTHKIASGMKKGCTKIWQVRRTDISNDRLPSVVQVRGVTSGMETGRRLQKERRQACLAGCVGHVRGAVRVKLHSQSHSSG